MTTRPDLDAIRTRMTAATWSPWQTGPSWAGANAVLTSEGHPIAVCGDGGSAAADAAFIAHARQDVADLLAEALRKVVDLHAPRDFRVTRTGELWRHCAVCEQAYPCGTVHTIAAALGITEGTPS